jgi:hypothetical protein
MPQSATQVLPNHKSDRFHLPEVLGEHLDPVGQHRIALKRTNQSVLGLLTALDHLPVELEQRP